MGIRGAGARFAAQVRTVHGLAMRRAFAAPLARAARGDGFLDEHGGGQQDAHACREPRGALPMHGSEHDDRKRPTALTAAA